MKTKRYMVNRIAAETGYPKVRVSEIVNAFLDEVINNLSEEGRMELRSFGVFSVVDVEAYTGRNPKTGEPVEVPARKHVRFRASKKMREKINT